MGNPVVHFEIIGENADLLRRFYRDAFEWTIGNRVEGAGIADYSLVKPEEGGGIEGGIGVGPEGYPGHATFYVAVPDIFAALRRIRNLGGKTIIEPRHVPGGPMIALFADPEGHIVGLLQGGS